MHLMAVCTFRHLAVRIIVGQEYMRVYRACISTWMFLFTNSLNVRP